MIGRTRIRRGVVLIAFAFASMAMAMGAAPTAKPEPPLRAVLASHDRVNDSFIAHWKAKGATAAVVPLDEHSKKHWASLAESVERAGLTLWPWIEVARNPEMASRHPEWIAAIGVHHDDWRRRFPLAGQAKPGEVIKAWPWTPIGYAPAFEAHRARLNNLLDGLPGAWPGAFLNDLQAGPSSCGCGNDQCRWALDYGAPATAAKTPGDDAAARMVAELAGRHRGKTIVPVWVTECETIDLPDHQNSTKLCGGVFCARGDCWPRYVQQWNPLVKAANGPIALACWSETFQRDAAEWWPAAVGLFQNPPRGGASLEPSRTIVVIQAWNTPERELESLVARLEKTGAGWILALSPIDQSWTPRVVSVPNPKP